MRPRAKGKEHRAGSKNNLALCPFALRPLLSSMRFTRSQQIGALVVLALLIGLAAYRSC
jgi:hypothetical protein